MGRLSVLCFAGTYALALVCDLARPWLRNVVRWRLAAGLLALGLAVHSAFLLNRLLSEGRLPAATVLDALLALAWLLALIDLVLLFRLPTSSTVGLFLLPIVLALSAYAGWRAPREDWTGWGGTWGVVWLWTHVSLLLAGAACICVAFAAGLMYLAQAHRLKHKQPATTTFALPSLEQSDRWNRWGITWAFPLLSAGVCLGLVLISTQAAGHRVLEWTDPKVISTFALWAVAGGLLYARYRPEWQGWWVMVLTVVAFAALVFSMVGVGLVLPTKHGVSAQASIGRPAP